MGLVSLLGRLFGSTDDSGTADDPGDASDDSSVWSAVPYGQWGRHAEGGGITKAQQADEVQKVNDQAEQYEDVRDY